MWVRSSSHICNLRMTRQMRLKQTVESLFLVFFLSPSSLLILPLCFVLVFFLTRFPARFPPRANPITVERALKKKNCGFTNRGPGILCFSFYVLYYYYYSPVTSHHSARQNVNSSVCYYIINCAHCYAYCI